MPTSEPLMELVKTGLPGMDAILHGGLPKGRIYLLEGVPGVGKTTLGLQFLLEGERRGERTMLVSLIETRGELRDVARSHGWDLEGIHILELPQNVKESAVSLQTVFPPGEIEYGEIANAIFEGIERYRPDRLMIDSISQLSMLTDNWQQMRSSVLKIRDLIHELGATTLVTSSKMENRFVELDTIVHGVVAMEMQAPEFGPIHRELIVKKLRGHQFRTGHHNYRINTGGIDVFTWPRVAPHNGLRDWQVLSSGIRELDTLLGGGLEEGTACLISGSTGAGKSTLASLYVQAAAKRGENSLIFCFDERRDTFLRRSASLRLDMSAYIEEGLVDLRQVDTRQLSPGEFAQAVVDGVNLSNAKVLVIDSLTGYLNAMPGLDHLMIQLHELLNYLSGVGVLTIMVVTKYGAAGNIEMEIDASYIADTVIVMRHFEAMGTLRRCIAVVKKRHGDHEHMIREFKVTSGGCRVGPPLRHFSGILTGNPTYYGEAEQLIAYEGEDQAGP